ncbi:MAG: 30S ribosomal protein S18 [Candidatus Omnitrophota bacterium]
MKAKTKGKTFSKRRQGDKRRLTHGVAKKKFCRLCIDKVKSLDYKDAKRLEAFITERGKIISRRYSGNCAKHQRLIANTITKSRFISLLPYTR